MPYNVYMPELINFPSHNLGLLRKNILIYVNLNCILVFTKHLKTSFYRLNWSLIKSFKLHVNKLTNCLKRKSMYCLNRLIIDVLTRI